MQAAYRAGFPEADLADVAELEARGEQAYADMYEAPNSTAAAGCYNDAKDYFARAIGCAERAGLEAEAQRLRARNEHIIAVYRRQFGS